jgi:hypothetical protein
MHNPAPKLRSLTCLASTAAALLLVGCAGPALQIDNPGQHRVFLDGVEETRQTLPFRYYGTLQCDVLPGAAVQGSREEFRNTPSRRAVAVRPPANPWMFPLDLPVELWAWAWHGQPPTTVTAELSPRSDAEPVLPGVQPSDLRSINERALQARISR